MSRTVILAGGGTGGHIYPNVAIAQRLLEIDPELHCLFVISDRSVDQTAVASVDLPHAEWAISSAQPLHRTLMGGVRFLRGWLKAGAEGASRLRSLRPMAVVATGGFVSAPEVVAASRLSVPTALVSLDATPGAAILRLKSRVDQLFSVYRTPRLPRAEVIGFPLRREVVLGLDAGQAREQLSLERSRRTLLVTAGSQGASTINRAIAEALREHDLGAHLRDWQVLHHTGGKDEDELAEAYGAAGVSHRLVPYLDAMGLAWSASDLVIARPGASSVAEAWSNHVPAIFLPYPFHRDEHQRLNAEPMVTAGGAVLLKDQIDPVQNAKPLCDCLYGVLGEKKTLAGMRDALRRATQADGALRVAQWALGSG